MIRISSPGMQDMRISQELNITNIQNHMQRETVARLLQHLQSFLLGVRERRDDACVGEAGERADVVGVPFCVNAALVAAFEVDDACADIFVFALAGLAFAIEVPDWFGEGFEDVGAFGGEGVVDVVGGDDVGFAAFEGFGDTEEADDIGVIGVEELAVGGMG